MPTKILGCKAYHRIPHLIGSHATEGDFFVNKGMNRICTQKTRDPKDKIICQEKLDGTSVAIARINGILVPVTRKGWQANTSKYKQHHLFSDWFYKHQDHFEFLNEGQRVCGEWLAQAHGTLYTLQHEPFVPFDIIGLNGAKSYNEFNSDLPDFFPRPHLLHDGSSISIEEIDRILGYHGHHGATELAEGAVYRVEREGKLDFMAKYVRAEKKIGYYLNKKDITWNINLDNYL